MYDKVNEANWMEIKEEKIVHRIPFKNDLWLTMTNRGPEKVNFIEHWELQSGLE